MWKEGRAVTASIGAVAALVLATLVAAAAPGPCFAAAYSLGFYLWRPLEGSAIYQGHGADYSVSLTGKAALLTGSTRGMGLQAAKWFHALGADVVLPGMEPELGTALAAVRKATDGRGTAHGLAVNLADFADVRRFAREVRGKITRLHYMVLGPAIHEDRRVVATSGHNRVFAANFLGQFLLTALLSPLLERRSVVVVVGGEEMWWGQPSELVPFCEKRAKQQAADALALTGLAKVCFARSLRTSMAARNLTVVAMAPGLVAEGEAPPPGAASAERAGERLFESAFVTGFPTPDFLYPYWFPRAVFDGVLEPLPVARDQRQPWFPTHWFQRFDYNLYAGGGPACDRQTRNTLWRKSVRAVDLPGAYITDDWFIAAAVAEEGRPPHAKAKPKGKAPHPQQQPKGKPSGKPPQGKGKPPQGKGKPGAGEREVPPPKKPAAPPPGKAAAAAAAGQKPLGKGGKGRG